MQIHAPVAHVSGRSGRVRGSGPRRRLTVAKGDRATEDRAVVERASRHWPPDQPLQLSSTRQRRIGGTMVVRRTSPQALDGHCRRVVNSPNQGRRDCLVAVHTRCIRLSRRTVPIQVHVLCVSAGLWGVGWSEDFGSFSWGSLGPAHQCSSSNQQVWPRRLRRIASLARIRDWHHRE